MNDAAKLATAHLAGGRTIVQHGMDDFDRAAAAAALVIVGRHVIGTRSPGFFLPQREIESTQVARHDGRRTAQAQRSRSPSSLCNRWGYATKDVLICDQTLNEPPVRRAGLGAGGASADAEPLGPLGGGRGERRISSGDEARHSVQVVRDLLLGELGDDRLALVCGHHRFRSRRDDGGGNR